MNKPTVYLDTSVISAYWYAGRNVAALARCAQTREWWHEEREHFAVCASVFAELELRDGRFPRQSECLRTVLRQPYLSMTATAKRIYDKLIASGTIPATKPRDALHLAVASAHEIDYLLTWNYAHLANPVAQVQAERLCRELERRAPLLVSPESIPQVRFGQTIRRRKEKR